MVASDNILRHQGGGAAVQYALVAALVSMAILTGTLAMRGSLIDLYQAVGTQASQALVQSEEK